MKKCIILCLIIACVAPLYLKGPNGEPIMSLSDWIPTDTIAMVQDAAKQAKSLAESAPETLNDDVHNIKDRYYKWQDEQGIWQLTQSFPAHLEPSKVQVKFANPNANVVKSLSQSVINEALKKTQTTDQRKAFVNNPEKPKDLLNEETSEEGGFSLMTISPSKLSEMTSQAQSLNDVVKKRSDALNNIQ